MGFTYRSLIKILDQRSGHSSKFLLPIDATNGSEAVTGPLNTMLVLAPGVEKSLFRATPGSPPRYQ